MTTTITGENILRYWRTGANLTQSQFATAMGVPLRTYEDLEAGKATIRPVHLAAAQWGLIILAADSPLKMGFLPLEVSAVIEKLTKPTAEAVQPASGIQTTVPFGLRPSSET
ncbi:helix-turn-helix domain-containing protein [Allorhizobium borbori]|uniref:Transcriptional regulator with XRE-family HTH domain n=1 Tax=Allorhizobium borbori TaxID=485907 RepID=A0A7W6K3G7_9HYPH|nr:helix-turn-helix transcriptional regulator [Allorhizobium borbori]MBB4103561.1 transcriptional regulator with XRE-family HTH domain [Allorhizobium borbori]